MGYAKYTIANAGPDKGKVLKDGHTMLILDIVNDLNRKSFLEEIVDYLKTCTSAAEYNKAVEKVASKEPPLKEKILNASNIQKIEWDEENLIIHFHNRSKYQYFDIPEKISIELGNAESPGAYLHHEIKGKYRYARID